MKGKGRSRQAILAAVTRVSGGAGRYCLCFNRTGIGVRSTDRRLDSGRTGLENIRERTERSRLDGLRPENGWYYLDPQTGRMMTGWITVDGRRYYMNTTADGVEGQMRRGWWKDNAGKMVFLQHCIRWNGRYDRDRMAVD